MTSTIETPELIGEQHEYESYVIRDGYSCHAAPGCSCDWLGLPVGLYDEAGALEQHGAHVARVTQAAASRAERQAQARTRLTEGYAMHYINNTEDEPTDANIARALARCCRAPKPAEYPAIRAEVLAWRNESGKLSRRETAQAAS